MEDASIHTLEQRFGQQLTQPDQEVCTRANRGVQVRSACSGNPYYGPGDQVGGWSLLD